MKHVQHILKKIRRIGGAFQNLKRNGILMEEYSDGVLYRYTTANGKGEYQKKENGKSIIFFYPVAMYRKKYFCDV